jgi:hypothetical protein
MSRLYSPAPETAIMPSAPLPYPFPTLCCCPLSFKLDRRPKQRLFNLEMRRLRARDTHIISTWSYGSRFPGPSESATPYTFCLVAGSRRHAIKCVVSTWNERSQALCSPDSLMASASHNTARASSVLSKCCLRLLIKAVIRQLSKEFVGKFGET